MSNPHQLCPVCHLRFTDGSCFCSTGLKFTPTETLGMSRPDLVCPECGSADHVIETPDHDQTDLCCLQTIARCWDCQVYWYASPYHRVPSPHSAPPQICDHQWTDLYTDRDSPQSYESGQYRGFKVVGRRCVKCGLTEPSEREGEV